MKAIHSWPTSLQYQLSLQRPLELGRGGVSPRGTWWSSRGVRAAVPAAWRCPDYTVFPRSSWSSGTGTKGQVPLGATFNPRRGCLCLLALFTTSAVRSAIREAQRQLLGRDAEDASLWHSARAGRSARWASAPLPLWACPPVGGLPGGGSTPEKQQLPHVGLICRPPTGDLRCG